MIRFFRKYWLWLSLMLLLAFLLFYFIPGQEKHYPDGENRFIEKRSKFIVLFLWGSLVLILLIYYRPKIRIPGIPAILIVAGTLLLSMYLVLPPFLQSAAYLLNRIGTKQEITKDYIVGTFNKDKRFLMFFDKDNKEFVVFRDKAVVIDTSKINYLDTISITYNRGLLGFNYIEKTIIKP